jgi:hypothetical protein
VKNVSVRVEDELFLAVKRQVLVDGVTLQEVVVKMLGVYARGKVKGIGRGLSEEGAAKTGPGPSSESLGPAEEVL